MEIKIKKYSVFLSFYYYYMKEVRRFMKVWGQTILGPIITTSLFLFVFSVIAYRGIPMKGGISYSQFLVPGLVMMSIIQNAFSNTSSSLLIAKINGTIIDTLMSPLSPSQVILALTLGSITRGIMIGTIILLYSLIFISLPIHSIFWMLYYAVISSAILGLLGIIAGIICAKYDQLANLSNLFITPMSFLSGTFYSIKHLSESMQLIINYNPFFYMIDGFRYAFIGTSDSSIIFGSMGLLVVTIFLSICSWYMWKIGYKIKT